MKQIYRNCIAALLVVLMMFPVALQAGNKDRVGEAGASELLINPWSQTSGWGNCSSGLVRGIESTFSNIAGAAFTKGTDVGFTYTNYMNNLNLMAAALSQQLGSAGVLSLYFTNLSIGEVYYTSEDQPEPTGATFSPNLLNVGLGFSRLFSNSISAGILVKLISESIPNLSATGVAFDIGIQYVTGRHENIKFGITLRNWGPSMKYSGDGFSIRTTLSGKGENQFTLMVRPNAFELPSQLLIGGGYDFLFDGNYRLTLAATFVSNAFSKDQFVGGLEFSFKDYLILRGGYTYESGITNAANRETIYTGPSCGATVRIPVNKEQHTGFDIDYSYRFTNPFGGIHSVGVKLDF